MDEKEVRAQQRAAGMDWEYIWALMRRYPLVPRFARRCMSLEMICILAVMRNTTGIVDSSGRVSQTIHVGEHWKKHIREVMEGPVIPKYWFKKKVRELVEVKGWDGGRWFCVDHFWPRLIYDRDISKTHFIYH